MHGLEVVDEATRLAAGGLPSATIARRLGVPRSTIRGWVRGETPRRASCPQESRCDACSGAAHRFAELPRQYLYLLGMYLGDGCIASHPRGVYRLRIILDAVYPSIIDECERAMRAVMPANKVGRVVRRGGGYENSRDGSNIELTSYSRGWPCLLPQHGLGRKHERSIVLTHWQKALVRTNPAMLVRGLIHSDGCRFVSTGRNWSDPRYSFSNRSEDIRGIFCDACDLLGVRWTTAPHTVYVSRKGDVAVLDRHIGPKQ